MKKSFIIILFKGGITLRSLLHKPMFQRDRLVTPSKVNKFFDFPQYSMKIVTSLGDDVTVEASYLENIGLM